MSCSTTSKGTRGGQPGNRNAVKNRPWREALDRAIKRGGRDLLDQAANKRLWAAGEGDLDAIKELANRLDGRPQQAVDMTIDDGIGARMQAAEERLRKMRNGMSPTKVTDNEDPEWMQ